MKNPTETSSDDNTAPQAFPSHQAWQDHEIDSQTTLEGIAELLGIDVSSLLILYNSGGFFSSIFLAAKFHYPTVPNSGSGIGWNKNSGVAFQFLTSSADAPRRALKRQFRDAHPLI